MTNRTFRRVHEVSGFESARLDTITDRRPTVVEPVFYRCKRCELITATHQARRILSVMAASADRKNATIVAEKPSFHSSTRDVVESVFVWNVTACI